MDRDKPMRASLAGVVNRARNWLLPESPLPDRPQTQSQSEASPIAATPPEKIAVTSQLREHLNGRGVTLLHPVGTELPRDIGLEPPCSLKWITVAHSLTLGAFSYAVTGYYFACSIGRYCSCGEMVQVGRHAHPMHYFSTSPFFYQTFADILGLDPPADRPVDPYTDFLHRTPPTKLRHTVIENDVWIGHGAFILPGVHIGTGAVVAAQAVVTHDVPSYAVVAGSPATVRKYRFPETTRQALLASRWWEFAPWQLTGVVTDDPEAFVGEVNARRAKGLAPYAPEPVRLADL